MDRLVFLIPLVLLALEPVFAEGSAGEQNHAGELAQLAGPNGVTQELQQDELVRTSHDGIGLFESWFEWKNRLEDTYGLAFGFRAWFLAQAASESLNEDDDAVGGIYRFQGTWTAFQGESGDVGRIEWRIEKRAGLGSMLAPADLSGQLGISALNTGFGYSGNFSTDLAVLNWTQGFANQRFGFAVGRLASDVYFDSFVFSTFSRAFLNRGFLFNPTLGNTGVGALGAVAKGFVTDQVWLGAHIHDANAVSGEFDFDTFKQHEWLKGLEAGWTPSFARRPTDRIQFLYWDKDERVEAGVSSGRGWTVTGSFQVSVSLLPFFRVGRSNGGAGVPAEEAVSLGLEYTPGPGRALGIGLGWAKPSEDTYGTGLENEFVAELSYRVQATKNVSFTPDVQLVFNPALNPDESFVAVFGLRLSLAL